MDLFDLTTAPAEAPEEAASSNDPPSYPPPARACLVCGEIAWQWKAEKQAYECGGDQAAHEEYAQWRQATFPWLAQA